MVIFSFEFEFEFEFLILFRLEFRVSTRESDSQTRVQLEFNSSPSIYFNYFKKIDLKILKVIFKKFCGAQCFKMNSRRGRNGD